MEPATTVPPPDCPPWCTDQHDELTPLEVEIATGYFHHLPLAQARVQPEGRGDPDRVDVELESFQCIEAPFDDLADLTPQERAERATSQHRPQLYLVLRTPGDGPGGVYELGRAPITLGQLVKLADDLRAATSSPVVARLALAEAAAGLATAPPAPEGRREPPATLQAWHRRGVADDYAAATLQARETAVRVIAELAGVQPHELTEAHVVDYFAARGLARWTRIKYLQHVKAWAAFAGIADPTAGIRRPPAPHGTPRPVSDAELGRLLSGVTGRIRLYAMLGAYAGLRSFETAKVALEDLEPAGEGTWRLRVAGKGGRVDVIPCHPALAAAVREYADAAGISSGRLFPGTSAHSVQYAIQAAGRRCGVTCSSHQLRHWYGTAVHRASGDLLVTQQLMRHNSPATTAGYAAVSGSRTRDVVDGLAPWLTAGEDGRPGLRVIRGGQDADPA